MFLTISDKDALVSPTSSALLYEKWHKAGKRVELHIFGNGEHGFGMGKENTLTDSCKMLFASWMRAYSFLPKKEE